MDQFAAFRSWKTDPGMILALLLTALVYLRGWRSLQKNAAHRFPTWRLAAFLSGLLVLYVAIASPIDAFAGFLLVAHMVQHLLLTMVVPPLLLLGAPWLPMLQGLPHVWVREVAGPFLVGRFWKVLTGFFAHPVTAWCLFVASNIFWHTPGFYGKALGSDGWHALEHGCFLFTSLLYWWHVILPFPGHVTYSRWLLIPYLLLADIQNTALGAFLTFYEKVLYPAYELVPRLWGLTALADQNAAGSLMWVPGSLVFLVPAGILAKQLLTSKGSQLSEWPVEKPSVPLRDSRQPVRPSWFIRLARTPFRRVMQGMLLLLAAVVVYDGFFGPKVASMNLAGVLPWTYWRGFGVLALLVIGNVFCSACPFVLARDVARKVTGRSEKNLSNKAGWQWPRALRNKWMAVALLASFLWAYEVFDIWNSPVWTAVLILGYFALAIGIDLLFRGASFCKYVCPIGQYHFAFSTQSSTEIGVKNAAVCGSCTTHDCLRGNEQDRGCETHLFQPKKAGNVDCTYCLDCVRACPKDNVDLVAVVPARDLTSDRFRSAVGSYSQRPDLAALFALFVIGSLVNAAGMTIPVNTLTDRLSAGLGLRGGMITTLLFLGAIVALLALGSLVARISATLARSNKSIREMLTIFVASLLPMGAALWASHFLFHLVTGAYTIIPVTQRFLGDHGLTFLGAPDWSRVGFGGDWIMSVELALLDVGVLASLYLGWRIAVREFSTERRLRAWLPWAALTLLLFVAAVWTMFQPMDMRGTMMSSR